MLDIRGAKRPLRGMGIAIEDYEEVELHEGLNAAR